ncbi:hypothetical protein BOTCAL_0730g00020 [Botryotinia calthae]|uniref:Uncharacterized protein n=1 Tax=Botryotinia calthae TaxID=38488 RepID=A0A4Y8CHH7_9HELO|nr:hypothetical protein BOTCAL_0730g00020 [Botryotinia calthae]
MELFKEIRRSILITVIFNKEEDESIENPKPAELFVSIEEEAIVQETLIVRLETELLKESKRSMSIPLPSEITPTTFVDAKSNNSDEDTLFTNFRRNG